MSEEMIIDFIQMFGEFMEVIEGFFDSFSGGYFLLITGLFIVSVIGVIFYVTLKQIQASGQLMQRP